MKRYAVKMLTEGKRKFITYWIMKHTTLFYIRVNS